MLHVWLIPAVFILAAVLVVFYVIVKFTGGTGVRTEGRTIIDKPTDDDSPPP